MQPAVQVLLSGALTFGVPIAFAVRELIQLKRPRGGPGWRDDGRPNTPSPPPPGQAPGMKPLPSCLIPTMQPMGLQPVARQTMRERVLEPAGGG